jgi:hypothetical protein
MKMIPRSSSEERHDTPDLGIGDRPPATGRDLKNWMGALEGNTVEGRAARGGSRCCGQMLHLRPLLLYTLTTTTL